LERPDLRTATMQVEKFPLSPPSLEELADKLRAPLEANYKQSSVRVVPCPDLRKEPYNLATEGLSGQEKIADVGGQGNLFPWPQRNKTWSMVELAEAMEMSPEKGSIIGAGAGPFHVIGQNCELASNFSWQGGFKHIDNQTHVAQITKDTGAVKVDKSPSVDCGLMINLYGSLGEPGPVLHINVRTRKGAEKSFSECIQKALHAAYGDSQTVSLGGVFMVHAGKARYHIMPDFPEQKDLPFTDRDQVEDWLTYHEFEVPMTCLCVLHSADPDKTMDLRMEHTHCFSPLMNNAGGHYHYDVESTYEDIEYEAFFNTAKVIYRVDRPATT
jgi:hypothetical protein